MRRMRTTLTMLTGFVAGVLTVATCLDGAGPNRTTDGAGIDGQPLADGETTAGDGGAGPSDGEVLGDAPANADGDTTVVADALDAVGVDLDVAEASADDGGGEVSTGCHCPSLQDRVTALEEKVASLQDGGNGNGQLQDEVASLEEDVDTLAANAPFQLVDAQGNRLGQMLEWRNDTNGHGPRFYDAGLHRVIQVDVAHERLMARDRLGSTTDKPEAWSFPVPLAYESGDCSGEPWIAAVPEPEHFADSPDIRELWSQRVVSWNPETGQAFVGGSSSVEATFSSGSLRNRDGECVPIEEEITVFPAEETEIGFEVPVAWPVSIKPFSLNE